MDHSSEHRRVFVPLGKNARAALLEALDDERAAEDLYRAVIARYGPISPFVNIVESERMHQQRLVHLLIRYGLEVPPRTATRPVLAETLEEQCRRAVDAEHANIAMYERFLRSVEEADIRRVFRHLQAAARDNHLPAFERCAQRGEEPE